jgi:hypothetical protein
MASLANSTWRLGGRSVPPTPAAPRFRAVPYQLENRSAIRTGWKFDDSPTTFTPETVELPPVAHFYQYPWHPAHPLLGTMMLDGRDLTVSYRRKSVTLD